MKNKELYEKAIEYWGLPFQIIMLGQEQAELFIAVSNKLRGRKNIVKGNIAEEIADCEIMMEQMKVAFNIPKSLIEEWKKVKLEKLLSLIKQNDKTGEKR